MRVPRSPYDKEAGLVWVPRMLDKARLMNGGELHEDYQPNLGRVTMDAAARSFRSTTRI